MNFKRKEEMQRKVNNEMNIKHNKTSKIKFFKDVLGRTWVGCRYCEKKKICYGGCGKRAINGFCMKGKLIKKGK
jgi:radical SAM protein with 4Fe4S-binding SPASM domain